MKHNKTNRVIVMLCAAALFMGITMQVTAADEAGTAQLAALRQALANDSTDSTYDINADDKVDVRDLVNLKKVVESNRLVDISVGGDQGGKWSEW